MSTLIRDVRLIDGMGAPPVEASAILVGDDGNIATVGSVDNVADPDATVIEGHGRTAIPGLIDAHVHLGTPPGQDRLKFEIETPAALKPFWVVANARPALDAGFTTLRDMGSSAEIFAAKRAIDLGLSVGPRILSAGLVSMTAGHSDHAMGRPNMPVEPDSTADGVDEVRKRVRQHVRTGHDWIKICTSGGVLSAGDESWWRNYTLDEIKAITDEAHALGRQVASHAHGRLGIENAILGGVDTIEHGIYLDDELIEMMIERGIYLSPTMTIGAAFRERAPKSGLSEEAIRKGNRVMEVVMTNMARAYTAGVRMMLGTDCTGTIARVGENAWEMELMVEIGMSPMEAIVASTQTAAQGIGLGDVTGTLEAGKKADIILVEGDPLQDIGILRKQENIVLVMKEGEIVVDRRTD